MCFESSFIYLIAQLNKQLQSKVWQNLVSLFKKF